jgi:hypothetical protein
MIGAAAAVLGVVGLAATPASADAKEHGHGRGRYHHEEHRHAYYREHGVHFSGGWYFRGRDHHHWERRVWNQRCHRWEYWEPDLCVWYFWSPGDCCFYPVTYSP